MFEVGQKVMFYVHRWRKWLTGIIESENEELSKEVDCKCYDIRQVEPVVVFNQSFNGHLFAVEVTAMKTMDGKKFKFTPKEKMIQRIKNLPFGDILYGRDKKGRFVNINEYDSEKDRFYGYDNDMKTVSFKFEDLPKKLVRY